MEEQSESLSTSATVVRNSFVMIAAQVILRALMVLFATYVARRLGSEEYGRYSLITSVINLFSFPADLGLSLYCAREIARDHRRASYFISNAAGIRLVAAVPVATAATLLADRLGYEPAIRVGVLVASGGFFLSAVQASLDAVLVGHERLDYSVLLGMAGQLLFMGVGSWALRWQSNFLVIIGASFLGVATTAALSFVVAHFRLGRLRLDLLPSEWMSLVRAALPIALMQLFFSVALRVDTFLLKQWQGDADVGWYNAAYDIVFGLFIIANGITLSVFATVSRLAGSQPAIARAIGQTAAKYLLLLSLPCALGGVLMADRVVVFLYGAPFAPTGPVLRLLLCALPIRFLVSLADSLAIVYDRAWSAAFITAGGMLLNITLNLLLIPRFGAQAAAGITIACEGAVLGWLLWVLRDQTLLAGLRQFGPGTGIALGAMAAMISLFWRWPVLALVGGGALTYGAVLLISQVVSATAIWRMVSRSWATQR